MKNLILIIALLFVGNQILAQNESKSLPISIGYFGNFGYQPGIKIGTQYELKNWETEHQKKKGNLTKSKSYFISPQVAFYSWPKNNVNLLINAETGYQRIKVGRNKFSSISIGLGYLIESRVTSLVYNLGDGSLKKKNRATSNFFLPTINYGFGKIINPNLTWYSKISLGAKLSTGRANSTVLFVETGLKFNLGKN